MSVNFNARTALRLRARSPAEENPTTTMHVFAATPVSVSFRLGQMVSQTMHRSVLAYNYSQRSTPPYHWAVDLVAADGAPGQLWISEGQPRV